MADKNWKVFERQFAAFFGCRRNVGSGSLGRSDRCTSDSTHELLHLEAKYAQSSFPNVWTLWKKCQQVARRQPKSATKKVTAIGLKLKGEDGFIVCVHSKDLRYVTVQWLATQDPKYLQELFYDVGRQQRANLESIRLGLDGDSG